MKKLTHKEYEQKLMDLDIEVFPVEEYKGSNIKILHQCIEGHEWSVRPTNVLNQKSGCPHCSGKFKKTDEMYKQELVGKNCTNIEPYVNARTPILHKCASCLHEWSVRPYSILSNGSNCPKCAASGGYNPKLPGRLYYIQIVKDNETYYKIGITNHTIDYRFRFDRDKLIYTLMDNYYADGAIPQQREKELLDKYNDKRVNIKGFLKSNGNTELFEEDVLNLGVDFNVNL